MNFSDIKSAVSHLMKTSKCMQCKCKYSADNINIIATTRIEGLFEMRCPSCHSSTIVTVVLASEIKVRKQPTRQHHGISEDEVLDMKNFLHNFDGNFRKIFTEER